jgi:hypothetical protein
MPGLVGLDKRTIQNITIIILFRQQPHISSELLLNGFQLMTDSYVMRSHYVRTGANFEVKLNWQMLEDKLFLEGAAQQPLPYQPFLIASRQFPNS